MRAPNGTHSAPDPIRIQLRAVLYREDRWWIAHCLELDIVAHGDTAGEAAKDLIELVDMQIETAMENGDLPSIFRPAPPQIWGLYWKGEDAPVADKPRQPVERLDVRELVPA